MKIRNPAAVKTIGFAGSWAIRAWMASLAYRYRPRGLSIVPTHPGLTERFIYAFWHENMLLPAYFYSRPDVHVLISQHADGEMISEICRNLRLRTIRGSTTRGGIEAVRNLLRVSRKTHLVVTPDGPRGPRRVVQPGLIYLASRTGLPIVPSGFGSDRPWRMKSWDRFAVPRPFSRAVCVTADPIFIPRDADRADLEKYRLLVERTLCEVSEEAEIQAETGSRKTVAIRADAIDRAA